MTRTYSYPQPLLARYEAWPNNDHRVVLSDGQHVGGLVFHRLGQFFGGVSVPSAAVFGVVVAPEARGRGIGTFLFRETLAEWRRDGVAISALYPSDTWTYRRFGWDVGGTHIRYRLPLSAIRSSGELDVERFDTSDLPGVAACYTEVATSASGFLDRDEHWWRLRVLNELDDRPMHCYLVRRDGRVTGYVIYVQEPVPHHLPIYWDLACIDLQWLDVDSAHSLLAFVAAQRPIARDALWVGPIDDPLALLVLQDALQVDFFFNWMARLVHVERAFESRGYPRDAEGAVELELEDPLVPANTGAFRLDVHAGAGSVTRLERARARIDIGALSALYTGWLTPRNAARAGRIVGADEEALATLERLLAGRVPSMVEEF